jgi:hypothetical protein
MTRPRLFVLMMAVGVAALAPAGRAQAWQRLDNSTLPLNAGPPAVASWVFPNGAEYAHVYTVTSDHVFNTVVSTLVVNSGLGGPPFTMGSVNLGGTTLYQPSALDLMNFDGTLHQEVFIVQNTDGGLWRQWNDNSTGWSGWVSVGQPPGGLCSTPSAVSWSGEVDRMDVFVVGCDGNLWQAWFDGTWHPWFMLLKNVVMSGGNPVSAIAGSCVDCLDVFVVNNANHHLTDMTFDATSWHLADTLAVSNSGWVTSSIVNNYPTAFVLNDKTPYNFLAAEKRSTNPEDFWEPPQSAHTGEGPQVPLAVTSKIGAFNYTEVYFITVPGALRVAGIQRLRYQQRSGGNAQGFWTTSSNNLGLTNFAGGLGAYAPQMVTGILVFAAKSDGTTWFTLDTDM